MKTRESFVVWLAWLALGSFSGCQTLHGHFEKTHRGPSADASEVAVRIGGRVYQPGEFLLTDAEPSLRDALNLAGGIRSSNFAVVASGGAETSETVAILQDRHASLEQAFETLDGAFKAYQAAPDEPAVDLDRARGRFFGSKTALARELTALNSFVQNVDEIDETVSTLIEEQDSLFKTEIATAVDEYRVDRTTENSKRVKTVFESYGELLGRTAQEIESLSPRSTAINPRATQAGGFLVGLRRETDMPRVTYYVPYDEVMAGGIAGGVVLQNGDVVSVVRLEETGLKRYGESIAQSGTSSGIRFAGKLGDQVAARSITNRLANDQLTTVLIRDSANLRGKDVFLIPTSKTRFDQNFKSVMLAETDRVDVTPTIAAPLFTDAIIGSIVADVVAERARLTRSESGSLQEGSAKLLRFGNKLVQHLGTALNRLIGF